MRSQFKFKHFTIDQSVNTHKIGTDSMLLGAWTTGKFNRILDIGTGTGILALMMAQKNTQAQITAIEPHLPSLLEAQANFNASHYKNRLMGIHSGLQNFGASEKFDLIISNPPYFENAYQSQNNNKNRVRHTDNLLISELYEYSSELLAENGRINVVIPFELEKEHIERAFDSELYVSEILHTKRDDGSYKRSLISFSFEEKDPVVEEMIVKHSDNQYSKEYIKMTRAFYFKDLSQHTSQSF